MTKQETAKILMVLTGAYGKPQADDSTISVWSTLLAKEHHDDVMAAVMYIIENNTTNGFMPTVPQIKETIRKMWGSRTIDSAKLIQEIEMAARNSTYNYMFEYNRLSDQAKKIVGSPSALQEYAHMSHDRMIEDVRKGIKLFIEMEITGDIPESVAAYIGLRKDHLLNG